MNESGIRFYNLTVKTVVLIYHVSGNNQEYSKRKITDSDQEKLCAPNLSIHLLNISGILVRSEKS